MRARGAIAPLPHYHSNNENKVWDEFNPSTPCDSGPHPGHARVRTSPSSVELSITLAAVLQHCSSSLPQNYINIITFILTNDFINMSVWDATCHLYREPTGPAFRSREKDSHGITELCVWNMSWILTQPANCCICILQMWTAKTCWECGKTRTIHKGFSVFMKKILKWKNL